MRIAGQESEAAWRELLESLVERHLGTPSLAVIDGNPGLLAALRAQWHASFRRGALPDLPDQGADGCAALANS
jgi:transposase-like protein